MSLRARLPYDLEMGSKTARRGKKQSPRRTTSHGEPLDLIPSATASSPMQRDLEGSLRAGRQKYNCRASLLLLMKTGPSNGEALFGASPGTEFLLYSNVSFPLSLTLPPPHLMV